MGDSSVCVALSKDTFRCRFQELTLTYLDPSYCSTSYTSILCNIWSYSQVDVLTKIGDRRSLGIRMESTADLDESGQPQCIHHKIVHINTEGLVREHQVLREGDEILEVNGRVLVGLPHVEAVGIVRDTPSSVRVVVRRAEAEEEGVNSVGVSIGEYLPLYNSPSLGAGQKRDVLKWLDWGSFISGFPD